MSLAIRYYIVSLGFLPFILNQTTDTQMFYCIDWNCEEFISRGKTLLNYHGKTDRHLSFKQNEDIKILGKPVDGNGPDWVGTVRRKVGLVPKAMVREDQLGKRASTFKYPLNQLPIWTQSEDDSLLGNGDSGLEKPSDLKNEIHRSNTDVEHATTNPNPVFDNLTTEAVMESHGSIDHKETAAEPPVVIDNNVTVITEPPPPIVFVNKETTDKEPAVVADQEETATEPPVVVDQEETATEPEVVADQEETATEPEVVTDQEETATEPPVVADQEETATEPPVVADQEETATEPPVVADQEETATDPPVVVNQEETATEPPVIADQEETATDPPVVVNQEETTTEPPVVVNQEETATEPPVVVDQEETSKEPAAVVDQEDTKEPEVVVDQEVTSTVPAVVVDQKDTTEPPVVVDQEDNTEPAVVVDQVETAKEPAVVVDQENTTEPAVVVHHKVTATEPAVVDQEDTTEPAVDVDQEVTATEPAVVVDQEETATEPPVVVDQEETVTEPEVVVDEGATAPPIVVDLVESATGPVVVVGQEQTATEPTVVVGQEETATEPPVVDQKETHSDHHHHHHHHDSEKDSSSFIIIVKHISSTLLAFLPEHLQDTILDVDDALVFTGIIALTLVSICVPYFVIEGFFSVRPLKKKVVELSKSLWKVSTAYENQQEEFEQYKKKALAYDEDKKRVEQLEYELVLLKKLEGKQKEQVVKYQKDLKNHKELTLDMQSFLDKEADKKKKILEEKEKLKTTITSLKEALRRTVDDLQDAQTQSSTAAMELELEKQTNETLNMKCEMLDRELNELKSKLVTEVDRRRGADNERDELEKSKVAAENELINLKQICQQYENAVSALNNEISNKENELLALQETLEEDSPLLDIAEMKAKLLNAEELVSSLQNRLECTTLENASLSRNLKDITSSLSSVQMEKDETVNRLVVLEAWFKEKEEDLRKAVERYEAEKNIRGKGKDELVHMLDDKAEENRALHNKLDEFRIEFEETKLQHKNEIRALETKSHEHWLSLCQAERKAQDSRKEAEMLRQKLTAITREKESEGINGDVSTAMYPLITPDMVPIPLPDDIPSYFGLGDGFMPPPPLPLDDDRESHRPAPLGRVSPTYSDLEDPMLSPIRGGGGRDFSDGHSSASDSPRRRSPARGWSSQRDRQRDLEDRHRDRRTGPVNTSSPLQ